MRTLYCLALLFVTLAVTISTGCSVNSSIESQESFKSSSKPQESAKSIDEPVVLELTYPAGESPKVFVTGWVFGAKCLLNPGTPEEKDISHLVNWTGEAKFEPATGSVSRPTFNRVGNNVISIEVKVGQEVTRKQYTISTVSPAAYAHVGDQSYCPSDSHGCPACPHSPIGPIITGSPNVTIDGIPAARVGDKGTATPCCGPQTFEIIEGDPDVLIDGKPAARLGDKTLHCGCSPGSIVGKAVPTTPTTVPEPLSLRQTILGKSWRLNLKRGDINASFDIVFKADGTFGFMNTSWNTEWTLEGSSITLKMSHDYKSGPNMVQKLELAGTITQAKDGNHENATMKGEFREWNEWEKEKSMKAGTWTAE